MSNNIQIIKVNIKDTYVNLSLKTIAMIKWAHMFCRTVKYIAKVDEDTYVNIKRLLSVVSLAKKCNLSNTFIGRIVPPHDLLRSDTDFWGINKTSYPLDSWPSYVHGFMYMFTTDIVSRVLERMLDKSTPVVSIEDVFFTGIVRALENVTITGIPIALKCKLEIRSNYDFERYIAVHHFNYFSEQCTIKRNHTIKLN